MPAGPPASRTSSTAWLGPTPTPPRRGAGARRHAARIEPLRSRAPGRSNGYTQAQQGTLPTQWHDALEAAASSRFLRDTLGTGFLDVFLAIKRQEARNSLRLVSDRDYEWYLDTA
ncbi:MAG: hypothetical protein IPF50_18605 [Proteobacteria bacterium]|nr:hypothetical protein [Pseudomonadota bacterium]